MTISYSIHSFTLSPYSHPPSSKPLMIKLIAVISDFQQKRKQAPIFPPNQPPKVATPTRSSAWPHTPHIFRRLRRVWNFSMVLLGDLQHSEGETESTETNGGAGGVGRGGVGGLLGNGGCSCGNGSGEDDGARGGCHDGAGWGGSGASWSGSIATANRLHDGASSGSGGSSVEGSGGEAAAGENLTDIF
ncbi:hypothetical protein J1614_005203 [Plenodomus biglobosus]|nr:hypothetical protein J1614_005203 [Plenodomus biglobosus]